MKPSIYISYAWGDNPDSEEELALQGLCKALSEHGFEVIHDRTHLVYHNSLPVFFKTIGEGGIVIPIIGKKYFNRLNCLIEALNMITRGDLKERIFPLVLSDNYDIYDALKRPKIIMDVKTFWLGKEAELTSAINYSNELPGSLIPLRQDLNILNETISAITPFINHIGTSKQFNFIDELKTNFKTFIKFIIQKTRKEIKKPYYQKIEGEYFGRENDIEFIDEFLRNEQKHFLLLYGIGGMGKSHLLSICLDRFNYERKFFWIRADKNFELRNLFEKCNLRFPKEVGNSKEICAQFLDNFISENIFLIIDDFYEIIDADVREMLPDLACSHSGKLLIISRAVPKEIEKQKVYHHQILPLEKDAFKSAMNLYIITEEKRVFTDNELDKIFDKAQGYPLGGQLIIRLADFGDKLDEILIDIPRFEAELDEEGKRYSERLLDNIFHKSKNEEIKLLCEFSALFGFPMIEEVRHLPSFKLDIFNTLLNRRRFITKDETGRYSAHAMIRDYAYEKLSDKENIHKKMGGYFERKLKDKKEIDWEISESAILHYKKVSKKELELFGQRMFVQFRNRDVKTIIEQSLMNTIRNYNILIEVYSNYMPYYNELGMSYRSNNQKQQAIDIFVKGLKVEPENVRVLNELGITYRENGQYNEAINICDRALNINKYHYPTILNLIQIYLFFNPNANKAKEYFDKLNIPPYHSSFKDNRKPFQIFIDNLHEIRNMSLSDFKIYDRYSFFSIQYKAYQTIVPLLFKLNGKFPGNTKNISRLGKTLSNQVISRNEEGWSFLKESISLLKNENKEKEMQENIRFYFYNLLNNDKLELLASEIQNYDSDIEQNSAYLLFSANYFQKLGKSEEIIINIYQEAICIAKTKVEKLKAMEGLLRYLSTINREKNKRLFEELIIRVTELVNENKNAK
jgi:tetratricopeptide (TPR) repeat protein